MNKEKIKDLIKILGFVPKDGTKGVYVKSYAQHSCYSICINFDNENIVYVDPDAEEASQIIACDLTTSNFSKTENFVVLECVNRLLEKGYSPSCIELERKYPLGRREKGRLDILVKEPNGTPYILIECKTWGAECDKEKLLMNRTGGQLFSYFANERAASYLCLYSSKYTGKELVYSSAIVPTESNWTILSGTKEIVAAWNGSFKSNGIFEVDRTPYNVTHTALTYRELQTITEEHSEKIFDLVMEILRHNVVSDKPNAFNKLLNLFVCKIIDEDRQPDDVVDFQLLENDGKYSLQMRLNDLYQKGMLRFLNIRVSDYSEQEIEELTAVDDDAKRKKLKEAITRLRLQKNPEFAFIEVCDDRTFDANDKILREIVGLLQDFKFRYAQKHQFLGDFFELLLSTSIKQESGQFFTPPPVTRFILASMPLMSKVSSAVESGDVDFLPTVIDFACGSGHFLTEYLEHMQNIIDTADFTNAKPSIKKMVRQYQEDGKFSWADKYVYGIDLDYRLVKTTKVSAFFNGDGEAKIIWANGLSSFENTPEYLDKLSNVSRVDKRDNSSFDILISNPPYSVEAFKSTLNCGEETFELFSELTEKSKEIECLFVERMKQLLKPGGWAGVILPTSLMTNGNVHAKAREILFKYFRFKAIAEMGNGTFMKTRTKTIILFLERRENTDWQIVSRAIEKFFTDKQDVTVLGVEGPFSTYAVNVREESFEEYLNFIKLASEETIAIEKDKLLYFILTCQQIIVLVKSGQRQEEKDFLGYQRSDRRGREGLRPLKSVGKLYDEDSPANEEKVSSYIYHAFVSEKMLPIHSSIKKHVSYEQLSSLINYTTSVWNKQVWLTRKASISTDKYPFETIDTIKNILERGISPQYGDSNVQVIKSGQARGYYSFNFSEKYYLSDNQGAEDKLLKEGDILINSTGVGTAGRVTYFNLKGNYVADSHITVLRVKEHICAKYVAQCLFAIGFEAIESMALGQSGQIELSLDTIKHIKIPVPPPDIQHKIVSECEAIEHEKSLIRKVISKCHEDIERLFLSAQKAIVNRYAIADEKCFKVSIGKRVLKTDVSSAGQYPVYSANVFEPFGYIEKLLITDFSRPSVLWGIDGDWMTSYIPANFQFYPTDHCGVLRVLVPDIHPRYLTWVLEREGEAQEFTRSRRASVDRIKSLSVSLPSFTVQEKTAKKVFELEQKIVDAKQSLDDLNNKNKDVLGKYL